MYATLGTYQFALGHLPNSTLFDLQLVVEIYERYDQSWTFKMNRATGQNAVQALFAIVLRRSNNKWRGA